MGCIFRSWTAKPAPCGIFIGARTLCRRRIIDSFPPVRPPLLIEQISKHSALPIMLRNRSSMPAKSKISSGGRRKSNDQPLNSRITGYQSTRSKSLRHDATKKLGCSKPTQAVFTPYVLGLSSIGWLEDGILRRSRAPDRQIRPSGAACFILGTASVKASNAPRAASRSEFVQVSKRSQRFIGFEEVKTLDFDRPPSSRGSCHLTRGFPFPRSTTRP